MSARRGARDGAAALGGTPAADAAELLADALVWDDHCGMESSTSTDLSELELYRAAGVNYVSLNVGYDAMAWHETIRVLAHYRSWLDSRPGRYVLVNGVDDVAAAQASGRLAVGFDLEGLNALGGDIELIGLYHALGVRQMLFAYNKNNAFSSGCHDEDVGLTDLGRCAVDEMNRVGVLIDCTHMGRRATLEVMERSQAPVVFSHSNPAGVWAHGRNIDDEQIRACAATDGVVGINGIELFLGDLSTETLMRHIQYVADLVGPRHVGFGLDLVVGGTIELPPHPEFWPADEDYGSASNCVELGQILSLAEKLLGAGWRETDVRGLLGENFMRVAEDAWTPRQAE
jgi:membrane dipeptidase